jgi:hypothetical protein
MSLQLETDKNGNISTMPIMGWIVVPAAEIAILLAIQYAETPQEIETGGRQIRFVLKPQQCLELAKILTTQAKRLLRPHTGKSPN